MTAKCANNSASVTLMNIADIDACTKTRKVTKYQ